MSAKFNIQRIIGDHWRTLRDYSTGSPSILDLSAQLLLPLLVSGFFGFFGPAIAGDIGYRIDAAIVAAFSIFTALLFNLQIMIMGMINNSQKSAPSLNENDVLETKSATRRTDFIKEIFFNISYAILIAIILVAISIFLVFFDFSSIRLIKIIEIGLVSHFLLVGFMILKRTHALFSLFPR